MQIIEMANDHGKRFKLLTPPLCWKCPKRFKLGLGEPWESESDADFDETVFSEQKFTCSVTFSVG